MQAALQTQQPPQYWMDFIFHSSPPGSRVRLPLVPVRANEDRRIRSLGSAKSLFERHPMVLATISQLFRPQSIPHLSLIANRIGVGPRENTRLAGDTLDVGRQNRACSRFCPQFSHPRKHHPWCESAGSGRAAIARAPQSVAPSSVGISGWESSTKDAVSLES